MGSDDHIEGKITYSDLSTQIDPQLDGNAKVVTFLSKDQQTKPFQPQSMENIIVNLHGPTPDETPIDLPNLVVFGLPAAFLDGYKADGQLYPTGSVYLKSIKKWIHCYAVSEDVAYQIKEQVKAERAAQVQAILDATNEAATQYGKVTTKAKLGGQIFIVTQGGENIKLGDVHVGLYTAKQMALLLDLAKMYGTSSLSEFLPTSLEDATSDPEGYYSMMVPAGTDNQGYYLYAYASRLAGDTKEEYYWLVPVPDKTDKPFFLTNDNITF